MLSAFRSIQPRVRRWTSTLVIFGLALILSGITVKTAWRHAKFEWLWIVITSVGVCSFIVAFAVNYESILSFLLTRRGRMGTNALISALLMAAIVVMVGWIGDRHHIRLDWTRTKRHTLSPQTLKILKGLKKKITIVGFYRRDSFEFERIRDLLESYEDASPNIRAMVVDLRDNPLLAEKYGVTSTSTVVFECEGKREVVSFGSEQEFTSAILKLTRERKKKIYFVQGHGEHSYSSYDDEGYSRVKDFLEKLEYKVEGLELMRKQQVPKDCDVLVIAGPQKPFMPEEIEALKRYLKGGGKALIMLDPKSADMNEVLEEYGVGVKSGYVFDIVTLARDPRVLLITNFEHHDITRPFMKARANALLLAECAALKKSEKTPTGYTVTELLKTTSEAWLKMELTENIAPTREDERGPFTLALAVAPSSTADGEKKTRLVLIGDSDFASNQFVPAFYNADFFLNTINWLAQEEELVEIKPREEPPDTFMPTGRQQLFVFLWSVIVLPLVVLMAGIGVWLSRR
ncbi:MAG: Gldg family protein [Armatimonadota bacterium]|nr:GldG family protein [Armatimonadota bacterium]MCX7776663.1 GldG family protein [Armatimonadota bacterium]MDW8025722.1 Gldg family protein [Armatimonadota bacterium]